MTAETCTFDLSLPRAIQAVQESIPACRPESIRFVRTMSGQLYIIVPNDIKDADIDNLRGRLNSALGVYSPSYETVASRVEDTLAGDALYSEPTIVAEIDGFAARLIERRAVGQDWVVQPAPDNIAHPPRFVFFSLKGGVGRSTALLLSGRHLANLGYNVLLVDFDLEAPGLGSQLLPVDVRPEFGVLDWLVEDTSANADLNLISAMAAESPISADTGLFVAPAIGARAGRFPENIIAKLARAYLDQPDHDLTKLGFSARLRRMLRQLEQHFAADVVLIDSRAGLHETAATTLLHLDAEVLLFAVDLPVTWEGYSYLFGHLKQLAQSGEPSTTETFPSWRSRLKMVHALATSTADDERHFAQNSYRLWTSSLYDEVPVDAGVEVFSFDEHDPEAPHWPLTILKNEQFERFDPLADLSRVGERSIYAAFSSLLDVLVDQLESSNDE